MVDQSKIALRKKAKKPNGFKENPPKPKKPDNDNDNEDDNDLYINNNNKETLKRKMKSCLNNENEKVLKECEGYLNNLSLDVIVWVLERTSGIKNPSWNYAKTVLDDFSKREINTIDKIEIDQQKYKEKKNDKKGKGLLRVFSGRDYSSETLKKLYANCSE